METYYEGRAMYIGPDIPLEGLVHGKHYDVTMQKMRSGRHRVTVLTGYFPGNRYNYKDAEELKNAFRKRPRRKGEADDGK